MHLGHTVFLLTMIVVNTLKCNVFDRILFLCKNAAAHHEVSFNLLSGRMAVLARLWIWLFRLFMFLSLFFLSFTTTKKRLWSSVVICRSTYKLYYVAVLIWVTKWDVILAEPQSRELNLILLRDRLYTTAVICVVWPVFSVLRCWFLKMVQWKSVHIKESTQSNTLRGCGHYLCCGF